MLLFDEGIHTFFKGISPKVNVIARLEFELAYYDIIVQHVSHYATGDLHPNYFDGKLICNYVLYSLNAVSLLSGTTFNPSQD